MNKAAYMPARAAPRLHCAIEREAGEPKTLSRLLDGTGSTLDGGPSFPRRRRCLASRPRRRLGTLLVPAMAKSASKLVLGVPGMLGSPKRRGMGCWCMISGLASCLTVYGARESCLGQRMGR